MFQPVVAAMVSLVVGLSMAGCGPGEAEQQAALIAEVDELRSALREANDRLENAASGITQTKMYMYATYANCQDLKAAVSRLAEPEPVDHGVPRGFREVHPPR
jgi:hypothetical protein